MSPRFLLPAVVALAIIGTPFHLAAAQEGPPPASSKTASAPLNLNSATPDQLASLPGIGPRTAQLIVEYRQKNGPFKKAEDLMNVRGIGEKSFLKLKPLVTVVAPKPERTTSPGA